MARKGDKEYNTRTNESLVILMMRMIFEKVGVKFDAHRLKPLIDFSFILAEHFVIKLPHLFPFYLSFYEDMAEKEIEMAGITADDHVLHVGCGPIPATSILIAQKTGAQVLGIDRNPVSVQLAHRCLSYLPKSSRPVIVHADAYTYPVDTFTVIVVSQGIKPPIGVLKHINASMAPKTRLIYRTSSSVDGELAENDRFLLTLFHIVSIVHHKKNGLLISLLLKKM
jgi:hypothetical protein